MTYEALHNIVSCANFYCLNIHRQMLKIISFSDLNLHTAKYLNCTNSIFVENSVYSYNLENYIRIISTKYSL